MVSTKPFCCRFFLEDPISRMEWVAMVEVYLSSRSCTRMAGNRLENRFTNAVTISVDVFSLPFKDNGQPTITSSISC